MGKSHKMKQTSGSNFLKIFLLATNFGGNYEKLHRTAGIETVADESCRSLAALAKQHWTHHFRALALSNGNTSGPRPLSAALGAYTCTHLTCTRYEDETLDRDSPTQQLQLHVVRLRARHGSFAMAAMGVRMRSAQSLHACATGMP